MTILQDKQVFAYLVTVLGLCLLHIVAYH